MILLGEEFVELSLRLKLLQVRASSNGLSIDEDLFRDRHGLVECTV